MKKLTSILLALVLGASFSAQAISWSDSANAEVTQRVQKQQAHYDKRQPVPWFDYSLTRDVLIQLLKVQNRTVRTYSVWRSDYGTIEGHCPSMGFGIPYDTSLTNPSAATDEDLFGDDKNGALATVEQPEPNGIYLSKNTNATWVICLMPNGSLAPIYTEAKVTVYPFSVDVDWESGRVTPKWNEPSSVTISTKK